MAEKHNPNWEETKTIKGMLKPEASILICLFHDFLISFIINTDQFTTPIDDTNPVDCTPIEGFCVDS